MCYTFDVHSFLEYTQLKILWWSYEGEEKKEEESKSQQKWHTNSVKETRLRIERENICCSRFSCVCWRLSWFRWFAIHFEMEKGDRPASEISSKVKQKEREKKKWQWSWIQRRTEFTGLHFLHPPNLCLHRTSQWNTLVNTDNYICTVQLVTALNVSKKLNLSLC